MVQYKLLSAVENVENFPEQDNIIQNFRHTYQIPPPIYNFKEKLIANCFTLVFTKQILLG